MSMMGELNYFLGLQIKQRKDVIFINQAKYTKELIKKFGLEGAKTSKTPMATTTKLDKDEQGINVDIKLNRSMIGSLLYLTASRPDIMFCVCLCAQFQSCPKESHLITVKRIIRYLKGTIEMGLWYPKTGQFSMTSFRMPTMRVVEWIGRVQVEHVNFSIIVLFHGLPRSKIR